MNKGPAVKTENKKIILASSIWLSKYKIRGWPCRMCPVALVSSGIHRSLLELRSFPVAVRSLQTMSLPGPPEEPRG
ncbi:hypothetical protein Y1Q_0004657 [Alligator mississippiensis]|uniref:Uncharacterized protein n=1 Tax=Alligator mississippiensis TaxID=8496 RepID=A0A151MHS8_ALLMI|nr:hypothetical protein Y1Q_0004657 [Alligator mississippiensis]